ncbi:HET-domain-containing protein [Annulohypoxylon truncatum]|uniref:HET-domain-containing protein n=1 Tax=Annulohypoxylon truncatum TaxID=327061 RepID=UPI0020077A33|nr:HET-domain-containing protein [Annulohypoxylon truncatum]KAI1206535.1 HET-domain-containing protein [Annulohypoxylon truncatum]
MYDKLDQSKSQIRLIRLLPGHDFDEIHCELFTVSLDESNAFEALSYVWGKKDNPLPIILGGQETKVTRSLESALRHLRYDEKERILWVDAVCINQGDDDERRSQVQLMQRVYSSATQVVVWLGPLQEKDEQTIEMIERLGSDRRLHWSAIPNIDFELLRLYRFLRHDWWSRIWTAQEAALAKQIIYYRGKTRLSSHVLTNMAISYTEHVSKTHCCDSLMAPKNRVVVSRDVTTLTENILQLRQFQLRTRNYNFDEVALMFRHRQATDPLDKVYGLLGISCGIKESSIDYRKSKAEVYELATRDIISHNNNLNILSHIFHSKPANSKRPSVADGLVNWPKDVPSWVPDWTIIDNKAGGDIELIRYKAPLLDHYNACGTLSYKSMGDTVAGRLHVNGVCCDTIEEISNKSYEQYLTPDVDIIQDWRRMAGMEKDPGKGYVGGDTVSEAFWRTLCLDIRARTILGEGKVRLIRRAGDRERAVHLAYWYTRLAGRTVLRVSREEAGFMKRVTEFDNHILKTTVRRRFVISRKGYMGLAPSGVEIGDHICILAGGKVPFIVRAVQHNDSQATSRFVCRLLGDSYIHGLMDGEAMKLVDDGVLKVEDFELI